MCMITEKPAIKNTGQAKKCVTAYNLPVKSDAPIHELLKLCSNDKKRESGNINYIICPDIGKAIIEKITIAEFENLMGD